MIWQFTCYNGTVWDCPSQVNLDEALRLFKKETGLVDMDIKKIENLH